MRRGPIVHPSQPAKMPGDNLCYTASMQEPHPYWIEWAQKLHSLGVSGLAAAMLNGAGSIRLLAAQLVHAGSPLFSSSKSIFQWQALADMLEDKDSTQEFVALLRKEASEWSQ